MPEKIKLLIVEDEKLMRVGLKALLEAFPIIKVIGEAENGQQSVKLAGELKPDVILMDIGMRIMNGIEATRRIKESYPEIKIFVLTSHITDEQEVMEALTAGASAYAAKDIDTATLVTIIQTISNGAFWLDPNVAKFFMQKSHF